MVAVGFMIIPVPVTECRQHNERKISADLQQRPIGRLPIGNGQSLPIYQANNGYIDTLEGNKLYAAYQRAKRAYEDGKKAYEAAKAAPVSPAAEAERREPHHRRRKRRRPRGRRNNKPAGGCSSRCELSGGRTPRNPGTTCQRSA